MNSKPRIAIIGAGMSGILAAIKLRDAGYRDVVIYEKAAKLGGTWRDNTYPGLSCDIPSHAYSYSFALNPEWTRHFSPGAEIQAYFEGVAQRYGIAERIRFDSEIAQATWRDGKMPVNVSGGLESKGHPVSATGIANIWEIATHLRGEAGPRQIENAKVGLAHVIGLGSACGVHILEKAA